MDLNNWWVAALILFVLFSLSGWNGQVDQPRSTDHEDDDDPYLLVLQQQQEDQMRHDWEERQRDNWGTHFD